MKPLVLVILDGWGHSDQVEDNGILSAKTPFFDSLKDNYPHTLIDASGPAVGLPDGIMGNSEVGHMNIGSGRIIYTGLSQIYKSIDDKDFFQNEVFLTAIKKVKENNSALHLMGLLSDGAVHSHQDHLYALLKLAKDEGLDKVFIHCFLDGRDTPPQSGKLYLNQLEEKLKEIGIGKIASISGRYYAMDRDQRWDRVELAYHALIGSSELTGKNSLEVIESSYQENITDEFVKPTTIVDDRNQPVGSINGQDAVIFFNFRADRAREITQALTQDSFSGFKREKYPKLSQYVCMSPYSEEFDLPVAFRPNFPDQVLGEILAQNDLTQLRIAETEKYAHVTYFFNGGREVKIKGEDRILIPSNREVPTYDHCPEMSAGKITQKVNQEIDQDKYDVIILNFANADMVGHTAIPDAIKKAIETIDHSLKDLVSKVLDKKGAVLITADHGNSEKMKDEKGEPHTAHTTNLVPFMLISDQFNSVKLLPEGGRLCDIAPTMLELLSLKKPLEMTGQSLIISY
jgi:2,3-bisphosphoglycerate-independent phosphoglycerate mutase